MSFSVLYHTASGSKYFVCVCVCVCVCVWVSEKAWDKLPIQNSLNQDVLLQLFLLHFRITIKKDQENQKNIKLNVTNQLLVYANVNL